MRALRVIAMVIAAWVLASALGVFVAVGPMRLLSGEVSALSVAATVAVLALLTLVFWLYVRPFGRWWKRALVILAAIPLLWIGASPLAIAVWAAHPVRAEIEAERPAAASDVAIECEDGTQLSAWYLPSDNDAAVVLAHGAGSSKDDVLAHAQVLADAGYGVLMLDSRGHGDSDGAAQDLGWWGEADLEAAVTTLVEMPGVDADRVGIVGLSMGGEQAIAAAGADSRVAVVVAEGATARTAADKDGWLPRHVFGYLQRAMDAERDFVLGLLTDAPRPEMTLRDAAGASDAPMLLIAAGGVPDETAAAEWIAQGDADVSVWTVPGAGHMGGLGADPEEWRERVVGFLDEVL